MSDQATATPPTALPIKKSFEVALADTPETHQRPPIVVEMAYTENGERKTVEFLARPWLVPQPLMLKVNNMAIDRHSAVLFQIFEHALGRGDPSADPPVPDEYERWYEFVTGGKVQVQIETLLEILQWFFEESTGHPS